MPANSPRARSFPTEAAAFSSPAASTSPSSGWDAPRSASKVLKVLSAALCLAAGASFATGCKDTEVLTQTIYSQTASEVDYDNPDKFYIHDSASGQTSDKVASDETCKDSSSATRVQNLVVYGSKSNTQGMTAKHSAFAKLADFSGIEASDSVSLFRSKSKDAIDHEIPDEEKEAQQDESSPSGNGRAGSSGQGVGGSSNDEDEGDESAATATKKGKTTGQKGTGGGAGDEQGVEVVDATDDFADPVPADKIAAYGEVAVIVQMLGGKGALAAADKETLSGGFGTVFADEGAKGIVKGWNGDGGSAKTMNVDAIIKSGAQTILAYSGGYLDDLSAADRKKLNEAGVTLTVVSPLSNSTYIKKDVSKIASILKDAKDIGNAGKVESTAEDYIDFHDSLIKTCMSANGGKLAGERVYEAKNTAYKSSDCDADAKYTLLVDGYDTSAEYRGSVAGWTPSASGGVALASVGTVSSPTSFYIQAGGLINNAAASSSEKDVGKQVVWQFGYSQLSFAKSKWSYSAGGELAQALDINANTAQGWGRTLLSTSVNRSSMYGESFGSDTFPKLIVTSGSYKKAMIANSKKDDGIYHPYDYQVFSDGVRIKAYGIIKGNQFVYSCIGANESSSNIFAGSNGNQLSEDSIEVNPKGLVGSWTSGSAESVLEAAWINDVANESSSSVGWKEYVKAFYSEFYRYSELSNSQIEVMEEGER